MTVSSTSRRAGPFNGNGVTTSFPFTFKVFSSEDVAVYLTDAAGTQTPLADNYTVTLNEDQDSNPGGSVTYPNSGDPLATGETLDLLGSLTYDQETDLTNVGRFLPQVIENALDKVTILVQQVIERMARMVSFPVGDSATTTLPAATLRANKALVFDASGNASVSEDNYVDQLANVTAQAGAAASSAMASAASAGESLASATAAEASRDAIDNRIYPGIYDSNPITRPDGSAVQDGDMAFYTDNLWRRHKAGNWIASDLTSADVAGLVANHRISATAAAGIADNIVHGHSTNAVASDISGATIGGGGQTGFNNVIGGDGSATVGTATPNATSAGTNANYSAIFGGYDNVAGGLATILGGFHNYTGVGTTHCTILGGSFHKITAGDYNTIDGGTLNEIKGGTDNGTVGGGRLNVIDMAASQDNGTIAGGQSNSVTARHGTIGGGINNVASGIAATVSGGNNNTASATNATVAGGELNTAGGPYSAVAGGNSITLSATAARSDYAGSVGGLSNTLGTTATARFSGLLAGRQNTIDAEYAAITGGRECVITSVAEGAVASGYGAKATIAGQEVRASGYFAAAGDAQSSIIVARRQTTDATPTELRVGSTLGSRILFPQDTTWAFSALVVARRTDADNESAGYKLEGVMDRNTAASSILVGAVTKTILGEDNAAWDVNITADGVNGALKIEVTGEAGKTINWVARLTLAEITG